MTTTPASFKFNKVTTGMYDVEDRATGEALGEVYQNGALWQVRDITQPDGVWIANSYITGLKTVHANRKDAGQELAYDLEDDIFPAAMGTLGRYERPKR